jgi:hypothetical protein
MYITLFYRTKSIRNVLFLKPSILPSLKKKDGVNHSLDGLKRLQFLTVSNEINKITHT